MKTSDPPAFAGRESTNIQNHKGDALYIFIDLWNFEEFSQLFRQKHPSLFDDEGIECYWKGSYVCIPDFDDVLDYIGLSEEEMYEMFEKEN